MENFEARIRTRLPPSYRQLALTRGTLHIEVDGTRAFSMIPVAELGGPAPTSWVDEGDEEVDRAVKRAIYFAYAHDEWVEDFYAFDPDSVDERGEMRVGAYHHDTGSAPTAPDALERLGVLEQHAGAVSAITIARSQ